MCAVLLFGYLYITINILQTKIFFQILHLKPVLYKQTYSIDSDFATDTLLKMRALYTCHQQHKVQGTTTAHYMQIIEEHFCNQNSK